MNQANRSSTSINTNTPDLQLVRLVVNGNQEAFDHLYERYFNQVYRRVAYLIPSQDVEDVTQEVLIAMLRSLKSFRGKSKFGTWLRVITNRHIANYYRKNKRTLNESSIESIHQTLESPLNLSESELNRILINQGLDSLPEHYQEVILLRFAEGMKFQEMAMVLEKNLDATKSLFRRAISALQDQLGGLDV